MAVILGAGDAFHLIPQSYALCTSGLQNFLEALGIGVILIIVLFYGNAKKNDDMQFKFMCEKLEELKAFGSSLK